MAGASNPLRANAAGLADDMLIKHGAAFWAWSQPSVRMI